MESKDLVFALLPIASAYLAYFFAVRSTKLQAIQGFKQEKYSKLLVYFQGYVGETASAENKRLFLTEFYGSWVYCSDTVVRAINHAMDLVVVPGDRTYDPHEGDKAIGGVVLAMRRDLLGKTSLRPEEFRYIDVQDQPAGATSDNTPNNAAPSSSSPW